jgi:hypothetical protein
MNEVYARYDAATKRIRVRGPYAFKDRFKSIPGYAWDGRNKAWTYPASSTAAQELHRLFGPSNVIGARLEMDAGVSLLLTDAAAATAALEVRDSEDLPSIPGRTPAWLHQRQAYWFVMRGRLPAAMLSMGMGTGKSRTVIGLLEGWDDRLVLILAPRRAVDVWPDQFEQHADSEWKVIAAPPAWTVNRRAGYLDRELSLHRRLGKKVCVVVNHEASWRPGMKDLLLAQKWDTCVVDEIHKAKAPGGKFSKFLATLGPRCKRRLGGTGTPMPHSRLDVYGQYRFLDPAIYGTSFNRYKNRYAVQGGFEGRQVVGYQNEEEHDRKFGSIAYICGEEVLDLPPYHHIPDVSRQGKPVGDGVFDLSPKSRIAYDTLDNDFVLGVGEGSVTTSNALTKLLRLQQVTSGYVRDDDGCDRAIGDDKLRVLTELWEDLPIEEPIVVFARFHHDLDRIKELCETQGRRWGEVSGRVNERDPSYGLAGPRMRSDIDVCIVQEQAGGVGIDLTRAAYAFYYSLTFSLGDYDQSLKRVHRPGQTRATTYYHLIARGTKDEVVYRALRERRNVVEEAMRVAKEAYRDRTS